MYRLSFVCFSYILSPETCLSLFQTLYFHPRLYLKHRRTASVLQPHLPRAQYHTPHDTSVYFLPLSDTGSLFMTPRVLSLPYPRVRLSLLLLAHLSTRRNMSCLRINSSHLASSKARQLRPVSPSRPTDKMTNRAYCAVNCLPVSWSFHLLDVLLFLHPIDLRPVNIAITRPLCTSCVLTD